MRLLHTTDLRIQHFLETGSSSALVQSEGCNAPGLAIPSYAILSHTWEGSEEVSFEEMQGDKKLIESKSGFLKLKNSCNQAKSHGYDWMWIDTCCIDKTSSAELSEAINSMYRWYKKSSVCYVYLSDVGSSSKYIGLEYNAALRTWNQPPPRWYTRGWTLQELIAPATVHFYSSDWTFLGTKLEHMRTLSEFTGVDLYALGGGDLRKLTVARRMSWVAKRKTTVVEDIAYCLLGIFDINMPLLYGEGEKAFIRLQEEIMKISDDQSIFAWRDDESLDTYREEYGDSFHQTGLLASQPAYFKTSGSVAQFQSERPGRSTSGATNQGIKVEFLMCREACYQSGQVYLAVLDSQLGSIPGVLAGIRMRQLSPGSQGFARIDTHQLIQFARYDMQNQIDLKGFDPTEKQDKLVDLKLRTFYTAWAPSSIYVRQDPQFPLPPPFWLVPTNTLLNSLVVKEVYPQHLWDMGTWTMQPVNLGLQTFKIGAIYMQSGRYDCVLIIGLIRSESCLQPWCRFMPNLWHHLSGHIVLKDQFDSFQVDAAEISNSIGRRRCTSFHEDLRLVSTAESMSVSGRDMFLVQLMRSPEWQLTMSVVDRREMTSGEKHMMDISTSQD